MFEQARFERRVNHLTNEHNKRLLETGNSPLVQSLTFNERIKFIEGISYHHVLVEYLNVVMVGQPHKTNKSHELDVKALLCHLTFLASISDVDSSNSLFKKGVETSANAIKSGIAKTPEGLYDLPSLWNTSKRAFSVAMGHLWMSTTVETDMRKTMLASTEVLERYEIDPSTVK